MKRRLQRSDVAARYDLDPRGEAGTFRTLIDPDLGTYETVALAHLGRRQPTRDQLDTAHIAADAENALWVVWASELEPHGLTPKVGDQIVDVHNNVWVIRLVQARLMTTRYHCTCTKAG